VRIHSKQRDQLWQAPLAGEVISLRKTGGLCPKSKILSAGWQNNRSGFRDFYRRDDIFFITGCP
jgi:hypothetical protein